MSIIDRLLHVTSELARKGMRLAAYDERGWYVTILGVDGTPSKVWATMETTS
jgi:hypothetical protein